MWMTSAGEREWTCTAGKRRLSSRKSASNQSMLQVRVQPPLHQQLGAAALHQLLHLAEDRLVGQHVGVTRLRRAVESAELTLRLADVGVVDVAVDDEGRPVVRVLSPADGVGQLAHGQQVGLGQQEEGLFAVDDLPSLDIIVNFRKHHH